MSGIPVETPSGIHSQKSCTGCRGLPEEKGGCLKRDIFLLFIEGYFLATC